MQWAPLWASEFLPYARKLGASIWLAAGLAGFIGDLSTYATTAFQLALSLNPGSVTSHWEFYMLGYLPTQIPLAILEFAFTAAAVQYIHNNRPEIFTWWRKSPTISQPLATAPKPIQTQSSKPRRFKIDKFTKYAILTMLIMLAIMLVSTYVGVSFSRQNGRHRLRCQGIQLPHPLHTWLMNTSFSQSEEHAVA